MVKKTNEIVNQWVEEKNKKKNTKDNIFATDRRLEDPAIDVEITTHFHVITDGSKGIEALSRIQASLDVINNALESSGFSFTLGETTTTNNSAWYNAGYGSSAERQMKSTLRKGTWAELNVYLFNLGGKLYIWLTTYCC